MEAAENWCPPSSVSINRRRATTMGDYGGREGACAAAATWLAPAFELSPPPPPIYLSSLSPREQCCVRGFALSLLREIFLCALGRFFFCVDRVAGRVVKTTKTQEENGLFFAAAINPFISFAETETERETISNL